MPVVLLMMGMVRGRREIEQPAILKLQGRIRLDRGRTAVLNLERRRRRPKAAVGHRPRDRTRIVNAGNARWIERAAAWRIIKIANGDPIGKGKTCPTHYHKQNYG